LTFKGGGYAWGPVEFYFSTLADLHAKLNTTSSPISVLFLDYSFTPEFKYPSQLSEAALAYNYLLSDLQIDPANIILGSDSAGSNLALQLLRHIENPHPKVSIRIIPSSRPSKCILVSPWTSQSVASPSFDLNQSYDVITKRQLQSWGDRWADGKCDEFTDPLLVDDDSWASILPPTLVISGEQEIMQDDIKLFCAKLKKVGRYTSKLDKALIIAEWV
jgi:acetyl esterase/lipase